MQKERFVEENVAKERLSAIYTPTWTKEIQCGSCSRL